MGNKFYGMCSGDETRNEVKHEWDVSQVQEESVTNQKAEDLANRVQKSKAVNIENYNEEETTQMKEFDENILNYGRFINNYELEDHVNENVKKIEAMMKPLNISEDEATKSQVFRRDAILFNDGTIYKGQWSFSGKKQGYGIYIKPDGSKYEGMWNNDKIEGFGRYIDRFGNYYEGKLLNEYHIILKSF